ncbi:T9SS type A sorting domain-containing protein [Flavobacterium sp. ZS1P14]|uniref:T9SS type A sorting domain-containing protein n=1 Tax=Flavobacterium sp. ZS1P14 TaxID=3401729 RepID=UPI003AB0F71E
MVSTQAIDASYSGSEFSVSNKFEITAKGLSTKSFDKEILVKAFPNPTNDIVTVTIPNEFILEKIEMFNSVGQFVAQYTKSTISLQNLVNGNYLLKIYTFGGNATKKIIKL